MRAQNRNSAWVATNDHKYGQACTLRDGLSVGEDIKQHVERHSDRSTSENTHQHAQKKTSSQRERWGVKVLQQMTADGGKMQCDRLPPRGG